MSKNTTFNLTILSSALMSVTASLASDAVGPNSRTNIKLSEGARDATHAIRMEERLLKTNLQDLQTYISTTTDPSIAGANAAAANAAAAAANALSATPQKGNKGQRGAGGVNGANGTNGLDGSYCTAPPSGFGCGAGYTGSYWYAGNCGRSTGWSWIGGYQNNCALIPPP